MKARIPPLRKQGRPKYKWTDKAIEDYWKDVRKSYKQYKTTDYDHNSDRMKELLKIHASVSTQVPKEIWELIENKETTTKEEVRDNAEIALYTDGSKDKDETHPAGWGVAIIEGRINEEGKAIKEGKLVEELYGKVQNYMNSKYFLGTEKATNNTGELTAICEGLLWLKDYEKTNKPAAFYYDSKYAAKITTGEYRPKDNKHLAATARTLLKTVLETRKIRFEHIKGHSNDRWNDKADELADIGATGKQSYKGRYEGDIKDNQEQEQNNTTVQTTRNTKDTLRRAQDQRLINIRIEDSNKINIPKPQYSTGANRRSRFAFGTITQKQARENTNTFFKEQQITIPLILQDEHLAENIWKEIEEEEENNIFFGQDEPEEDDCA